MRTSEASEQPDAKTIYRSANLTVRAMPADDASCWIVSFDHFDNTPDPDRPGFGENFFRTQGWSAVHVRASGNDWYQYDDLPAALAAIRDHLGPAARIMTYGSSMGGYAAMRCAKPLGAASVLALSPQYSIEPEVVPWEKRWLDDAVRIRWQPKLGGALPPCNGAIVVFDPTDPDRHHAARLHAETGCTLVPLAYAGHPVTTFLAETHLLRPLVVSVRSGSFDGALFRQSVRQARRTGAVYLSHLALKQPPWRPRLALHLADLALSAAPTSTLAMHNLAAVHRRAGRYAEAVTVLEAALAATSRRDINQLYAMAETLQAAGQLDAATKCMAEAIQLAPALAHLRTWQAFALSLSGKLSAAIAMQQSAIMIAPARREYRSRLRRYRMKLFVRRVTGLLGSQRSDADKQA